LRHGSNIGWIKELIQSPSRETLEDQQLNWDKTMEALLDLRLALWVEGSLFFFWEKKYGFIEKISSEKLEVFFVKKDGLGKSIYMSVKGIFPVM
jgi:hypothetical protein